jgi:hypothetical protein
VKREMRIVTERYIHIQADPTDDQISTAVTELGKRDGVLTVTTGGGGRGWGPTTRYIPVRLVNEVVVEDRPS